MPYTQQIDSGILSTFKKRLGGAIGFKPRPITSTFMLIAGPKGSGKSYLAESIPNAIRLDLDRRSWNPNPRCLNVPAAADKLDYDVLMDWVQKIIKLANDGHRPSFVIFDSLNALYDLARMKVAKDKGKPFDDLVAPEAGKKAQSVWAAVANKSVDPLNLIRDAGVGVIGITNVSSEIIELNGENKKHKSFNLTRGFWRRIENGIETIIGVQTITEHIKRPKLDATGAPITVHGSPVLEDTGERVEKHLCIFKEFDVVLDSLTAVRLPFTPTITLPSLNPWTAVVDEWNDATARALSQTQKPTQPAKKKEKEVAIKA